MGRNTEKCGKREMLTVEPGYGEKTEKREK
jgi:hypothetical protein